MNTYFEFGYILTDVFLNFSQILLEMLILCLVGFDLDFMTVDD